MEMTVSLKKIMEMAAEFADPSDKPMLESIAGMLGNEATGRDHVRIVCKPFPMASAPASKLRKASSARSAWLPCRRKWKPPALDKVFSRNFCRTSAG